MPTPAGNKQLSIHLFPHRTRHFHLSTEMDSPNPSEMDIKVFIPEPTFSFTALKNIFPKWEKETYFLCWESEIKFKNTKCMTLNNI